MTRREMLRLLKGGAGLGGLTLLGCHMPENTAPPEKVLFWDDFEDNTLDLTKWSCEHAMRRENDLQLYSQEKVAVENGCLVLTARRENGQILSGSVHTAGKFEFGPGTRVSIRARLESGYGAWPAIWMQASRFTEEFPQEIWPAGGEIDLMEAYLPEDGSETTVHGYDTAGMLRHQSLQCPAVQLEHWHLYEMEWTGESLRFFLDNALYGEVPVRSFKAPNGFLPFCDDTNAMFIHLNLAVQRQLRDGVPVEVMNVPQEMRFLIDFVRVTAKQPDLALVSVAFGKHEAVIKQYNNIKLYVCTSPKAVDRTVHWNVSEGNILVPSPSNSVMGNFYAANKGVAHVTVTTPSGGRDVCRVTVV